MCKHSRDGEDGNFLAQGRMLVWRHAFRLSSGDVAKSAKGLLAPHDLVFVKGWTRSVCANIVMCCAYENPSFLEVRRFSVSCLPSRSGASA